MAVFDSDVATVPKLVGVDLLMVLFQVQVSQVLEDLGVLLVLAELESVREQLDVVQQRRVFDGVLVQNRVQTAPLLEEASAV